MFKVSEQAVIEYPLAEVFAVAADPETQLKWDAGTLKSVEKLTPGPLGQGAHYRGVMAGFGVVEYDFPEYEPGRRFVHHSQMAMGEMDHTFDFEAVPGGTQVTQTITVQPKGMGKLMAPLMKVMIGNRMRTINAELRQYLQTQKVAAPVR